MDNLTRRQFLKYGLISGTMAVTFDPTGRVAEATGRMMTKVQSYLDDDGLRLIPTACTECDSYCGLFAVVRGDRMVSVMGNPEHPVNKGNICGRLISSLNRIYDPDRILKPLLKSSNGNFDEIEWKRAYEIIASKWNEVVKYVMMPAVLTTGGADVIANLDAFNELTPELQKIFVDTAREMETTHLIPFTGNQTEKTIEDAKAKGVKFITLPESELAIMRKAALGMWKDIDAINANTARQMELMREYLDAKGVEYPGK